MMIFFAFTAQTRIMSACSSPRQSPTDAVTAFDAIEHLVEADIVVVFLEAKRAAAI